jgi:hypothetical protein
MVRFAWRAYPSAVTTGVNDIPRTVVDPTESLGHPGVAKATGANNSTNTAFALLKGICSGLAVSDGSASDVVRTRPPEAHDIGRLVGSKSDPAATDTGTWSLISVLKGIAFEVGTPA